MNALETAYKEGQWAWRAGKRLSAQPYCEEINGWEAIRWCLGWIELERLHRDLDKAAKEGRAAA